MNHNSISQLSDSELLEAFSKMKPSPVMDAFFIGFLIGILIFGAASNAWGFTMLIPLFLIYIFLKKPRRYNAMKKEIEKSGLL